MSRIPRIRNKIRQSIRRANNDAIITRRDARVERIDFQLDEADDSLTWINITEPGRREIEELANDFEFHELDFEDILSRRQRPKVDEYADYLFVVLHFPKYDTEKGRLATVELDLFVGPDFLITLPNEHIRPLSRVFHRCQNDDDYRIDLFSKGSGYVLYAVLDEIFGFCFPILDKIGVKLDEIEDALFEGRAREIVRDISNVKQEIIAYRKIIGPELGTLRVLETKTAARFAPGTLEVYYDDVIDAAQRIWDMLENYKEIIDALEGTNETVIQHSLNDILLILTILNALVLPMTFITGLWGMNVRVPLANEYHAFWIILTMIFLIVFGLALLFRGWRRR